MTKKQRLNGDGTPHVCEFDADGRCQMHPFTREVTTSNQCGVKGCKNTRDSGAFAGPFCAPCDHDLRTGNFEFGTSVVYEQARKIERAKRIMQRAISWLQIKEAAFTTHKGPAIIEEMQRYVGDLPVETSVMLPDGPAPFRPTDEVIRRVCLGGMRTTEEGREIITYLRWLERRQGVEAARRTDTRLAGDVEYCLAKINPATDVHAILTEVMKDLRSPEEPTETLTPRYECHVCGRKYLTVEARDHHQEECTDASEAWRQEKAK